MDIIRGLSNLGIETTHSSSQEEEQEVKRNWLELPGDVMFLIFLKLGTIDILGSVQWVCSSWWKLSQHPCLFRSIHVEEVSTLFGCKVPPQSTFELSDGLAREAIDRSCGQLVEFSVRAIADDRLLHYMSDKSGSLRCLRLVSCYEVSNNGLIEMAKKLPHLEVLEIIGILYISKYVIETFGRFCPQLKSYRLNYMTYYMIGIELEEVALAIAENMPELRHLNLFGNRLTDDGLKAVLDGCPHLESLDLRQCFDLIFAGDLKERCRSIKVFRLPSDSTDDFEYEQQRFPSHELSVSDFDFDYDYEYYESDEYYGSDDYDNFLWSES